MEKEITPTFNQSTYEMGTNKRTQFPKKFLLGILILILFALYSIGIFYAGTYYNTKKNAAVVAKAIKINQLTDQNSAIFANLKGSIKGKIIKVEGSKATIETVKGEIGIFSLTKPLVVAELLNDKINPIGNSLTDIRLGELAEIKIRGVDRGYVIYAITYLKDYSINFPFTEVNEASVTASPKAKK